MSSPPSAWSLDALKAVIERHWGYRTLRPLQEQAMRAILDGRDSLVVLPTGGGKSLCYQAPAVLRSNETTVVVSPLISLMKDQVDSLQACGVPAVQIDSSLSPVERRAYEDDILQGAVRLVFVSPERLVNSDFYRLLQRIHVRTFAIDEAHCISHWGHDFRPEYRQMGRLHEFFPDASIHAYTATATERVRHDIVRQLGLQKPEVLVGNFDRANLTFRVVPRRDLLAQTLEVIERHPAEAGIIYCIRRSDVDDLTATLQKHGLQALSYHAGLTPDQRAATQEAFLSEKCDLIVATVAFGMGIDRSNIRYVLHAAMPKSIEHYQQEAGRAGRDGLEAECLLLYSGADTLLWKSIVEKSAAEAAAEPGFLTSALQHIDDMDRYCRGAVCRHRALVQYFGQGYEPKSCEACDLCLGETEELPEAQVVAQKILSCVARAKEGFGINHIAGILRGENTENIRKRGHEKLSTFGLLKGSGKPELRDWIYQLIGQGVLVQVGDEYPILKLNPAAWEVMRGQRTVRLVQLARGKKTEKVRSEVVSWEGVDRGLFEELRKLRYRLAQEGGVPPYVIFDDKTLRQLARVRPSSPEKMRGVSGVGETKLRKFGDQFLEVILSYSRQHELPLDNPAGAVVFEERPRGLSRPNPQRTQAFELFRKGASLEKVMAQIGRARSTVAEYLCDFIREEQPPSVAPWVHDELYQRIAAVSRQFGTEKLKPLYVALGEKIAYEDIKIVLTHLALR
jgi:ATP-dependent DNA helicase RecQ